MDLFDRLYYWPSADFAAWASVWPEALGDKCCGEPLAKKNGGYFSLNFIQSGSLNLQLGKRTDLELKERTFFFIQPAQYYRYVASTNHCRLRWVRLAGPNAEAHIRMMGFDPETQQAAVTNPAGLCRKFDRLEYLCLNRRDHADSQAIAVLYEMMTDCCPRGSFRVEQNIAERIRTFMYDDLERGYNISQIADFFGLSRSSLFLHFKREFGMSPVKMLQAARLDKARHLLAETALTVEMVARASGYSNLSHFLHQFKAAEGMTPSIYRQTYTL
ncbi:MAG: helix-turn-helix domain-containing protein [Kiritimatiellales bacterium]